MFKNISLKYCIIAIFSSAFLAFGLYNVHSLSGVTEGGTLGMTLLLDHWFNISPAVSGFIMNALCYFLGWKLLGKTFIIYSAVATAGFSFTYHICEQYEHLWPHLVERPLLAAILGAVFVGVGTGICVRIGGAIAGDDALAMSIAHITKLKVEQVYLISDLVVLSLSASYIPIRRLGFSLFTVILSGQIIGWIQKIPTSSSSTHH